ncbi:MAG: ABC transporter substrate-binding protein [Rhodopseudomonas palustris]|uniref:ABC transporter substrate-binding protein n=1 Tax=Rhodopseudomonas palustris TaxID=1076 RepID=A0A933VXA9_RHOPL|nr:ABC transporter substrate-binding protein [Rhodopseudomonas palustris]
MSPISIRLAATAGLIAVTFFSAAQAQVSDSVVKIGVLNDQSGPYVDLAGPGAVLATQMAVEDFGGNVLGAKVEVVFADHQNKPDVGSGVVRRWFDQDQVDAVIDVPTSSVALAVQDLARQKERVFLISGAASDSLSGKACSPFSIQTSDDTYALSVGTTNAVVENGGDTWFFLTADYVFGHLMEEQSRKLIEAKGGKVLGSVRHPQNTSDFASYLLQAQRSGAKVIGLANAGNDTINAIRQAGEFGLVASGQKMAGLILFSSDIKALGLKAAQGLMLSESFYWDMNPKTREFSLRFQKRFGGKMPTREQATAYATTLHYLKAIKAAGTDKADVVVKAMKATPMEFFGATGQIRADGRFIHDLTLYQVKSPEESTGEWDIYKPLRTIKGEDAFVPLEKSECPLVRS